MADFGEIAHNLLTLEINTVLKQGMSAQKMPGYGDALIDLSQEYHEFLCARAKHFGSIGEPLAEWAQILSNSFTWGLQPFPAAAGGERAPIAPVAPGAPPRGRIDADLLKDYGQDVSVAKLDRLRGTARWLIEMRDRTRAAAARNEFGLTAGQRDVAAAVRGTIEAQPTDDAILARILRNLDQLKALPKKLTGSDDPEAKVSRGWKGTLDPDDAIILRKAWDVGTELVVMQTVVQLDGDVVSRIEPAHSGPVHATLHQLHGEAVSIAFRHWQFLAATVARFAGMAISTLLRRT